MGMEPRREPQPILIDGAVPADGPRASCFLCAAPMLRAAPVQPVVRPERFRWKSSTLPQLDVAHRSARRPAGSGQC